MPVKIKPTVGRVIYVRIPGYNMGSTPDQQPFPALITFVHSDTLINVGGYYGDGTPFQRTSLELIASDADLPELPRETAFAYWMPYQKDAAALQVGTDRAPATTQAPPPVEPAIERKL